MGVAWKLALNYLKSNRKRTITIAICILISTILITTILLLIDSFREFMISNIRNEANWEVRYNGITYEEACTIEKHSNVKEISVMYYMGKYESEIDKYKINSDVVGFDENALKNLVENNLVSGRLPQNSSEVVCDQDIEEYNIGDKILQRLEDGDTKEYTVVGKVEGYKIPSFNSYQIITLLDRSNLQSTDTVNITILSNNIKQIYNDYYDIYYMLKADRVNSDSNIDNMMKYNTSLLEYANVLDYTSRFQQNINTLEGIFIGIVVISSAIFIYSVINISIVERQRYFGILKSLGTTTKQMKRSIRVELLIILLVTIPVGVLIGMWLDWALITIVNNVLPQYATSYRIISNLFITNEEMKVAIPMSSIGIAILIIILTVYIASIMPIRKVSRMQAINMIKQNKESVRIKKVKSKGHRRNKKLKSDIHVERKLAFRNVERYKVRYSAIIMSLMISIALIIVSGYYIGSATENTFKTDYNYYIEVDYKGSGKENLSEKIIDDIQEAEIAKKVISQVENTVEILVEEKNISDAEKDFSRIVYDGSTELYVHYGWIFASDDYDEFLDTYYMSIPIISLNDDAFNVYLKEIGVDKLEENECILVDYIHEKTRYYDGIRLTNYNEGEEITLKNNIPSFDDLYENNIAKLKIRKITDKIPSNLIEEKNGPIILVAKEAMANIDKQMYGVDYIENSSYIAGDIISLEVKNIEEADEFVKTLQEKYKADEVLIDGNEVITQREINNHELLRNIFIYSFIAIITAIGILNMHNAINTSLEVRKREIVSLITIGMERRQINKMLLIENAICGILSLILGITIGLSISYLIYRNNIEYIIYSFQIPWTALITSTLAIIVIIIISTIYLKKKISANELTEILRKEEI